jgi:clan AA aspartic protease
MGATYTAVKLRALGVGNGSYEERFLVHTGATDCVAPASALLKIGVQPIGKSKYALANGAEQEFQFGLVEITVMGEVTAGRVVFGPENAEPLLGVTALESAGLTVDPNQTLNRLPAIPLK